MPVSRAVLIGILVVILVVVGGVAYYLYTAAGPAEPIKIGVLTPLSPPGDYGAGQLIVRGAEMAVEELNAKGGILGRKVELVVEDDSGTPEKGVAGIRKLILEHKVVAVLGQFHSSVCLAVQDVAEQYGIPLFVTQASSAKITEKHLKTTFRTHAIDPTRAKLFVDFIKANGFKRVAIMAELTDYGIGLTEWTKKFIEEEGLDVELKVVNFEHTVVDLTPQLLEVKAWNPDLIINIGVGAPAFLMISQAYDVGLFPKVPMLVSYDAPSRDTEYWENVKEKGTYILFITYYHPNMKLTEMGEKFREAYVKKYNEEPLYAAFNAYSQVMLIAQAIEKAGSADPKAIIDALLKYEFDFWNGKVKFEEGEGPFWHQWSPPLLVAQYTKPYQKFAESIIVFPPEMATGEMVKP